MFNTQPLSQRDPRWQNVTLGFGDASTTIGTDGCTLTCLTMVANGLGFSETPATLNDKLKALGNGRGFAGPLMIWSGLPAALPGISLQSFVLCRDTPAPMAAIDAALDAGHPVVIELDYSPQPGLQSHWVVIYARQDGDYLMHDPWPIPTEASASLRRRFGFAGTPAQIVTALVLYTGRVPQPTPPAGPLVVVVNDEPEIATAGGLALRAAPISGDVITRLASGTELTVRETADGAAGKVGQVGEWLQVSTEGATGYVAAWLVHAEASAAQSIAAPKGLEEAGPPVADPSLIGVPQPPLRRLPALVVEVRRAPVSVLRFILALIRRIILISIGWGARPSSNAVPLRGLPARRSTIIAMLKPGALLTVAQPADSARAMIGRPGQWLNVYDHKGREGFVLSESVRLTAEPQSTSLSQPLIVGSVYEAAVKDLSASSASYPRVQVIDDPDVATAGGLALRTAPIGGSVKMRLPADTQLEIREPADVGLAKVGQLGQWLRVCNSEGVPGYVAAWYVSRVATPAPVPQQPPTLPPQPSPGPQPTPSGAPATPPEVIAQGVVIANAEAPVLNSPQSGSSSAWRVTAGTPLRVVENDDWSSKLGKSDQFVQVQSYAFKTGFVQASLLKAPDGVDKRAAAVDAHLPKGVCAWLYGLHDTYDRGLFGTSGKTGWVLVTERVGSGAGNQGYADWANNGHGVIVRLNNDYGGSGTIPTPDQYDAFAGQCAQWVRNSQGCNIWVIGNEMNNPREWPDDGRNPGKAITPELYAYCYNKVRSAIKAVQPGAIVVPGAVDPFQGPQISCLEWFRRMLAAIGDLDGIALHCYTNGYAPNLVTDLGCFGDDPLRWQYYHFRAYTTFLDVIPPQWRGRPVYITETDAHGGSPWSGGQNGWVQAAYSEIGRWNQQPFAQQIQSLILYRWSRDDRYSILDKPGVQTDLRATIANSDYRWRQ